MPDPLLGSRCARFHLKDGRSLIFQTISRRPRRPRRHRAREIVIVLLVALGLVAATLFAKGLGRADARAVRSTRGAAVISLR